MTDFGGTDAELLADPEFAELLVTAMRADYAGDQPLHLRPRRSDRARTSRCWERRRSAASMPPSCGTLGRPHRGRVRAVDWYDGGHFYLDDHIDARRRAGERRWLTTRWWPPPIRSWWSAWRWKRPAESTPPTDTGNCWPTGREALTSFPMDRGWSVPELFAGSRRSGFKEIHDRGGFLTGATMFDPEFFGISPREAVAMDPQQRVALRVSWRALENSGINPDDVAGHDMGCYLGASATGYGPQMAEFSEYSGHLLAGTALSVISGRIAYTLGSRGPAVTIDSSCASALVAFHAAVRALQNGDCDLALAGGVNVLGSPGFFVEFSKQHALSDDGHCRAYSAQASGTVWAEGAAIFVLQRKSAALRDGRQILAEVLGSAVNHDGRSAGLSAPSGAAQVSLFRRAIAEAGIRPDEVGMVEGHGTGTRLG